jgi:hypothetical protein
MTMNVIDEFKNIINMFEMLFVISGILFCKDYIYSKIYISNFTQ